MWRKYRPQHKKWLGKSVLSHQIKGGHKNFHKVKEKTAFLKNYLWRTMGEPWWIKHCVHKIILKSWRLLLKCSNKSCMSLCLPDIATSSWWRSLWQTPSWLRPRPEQRWRSFPAKAGGPGPSRCGATSARTAPPAPPAPWTRGPPGKRSGWRLWGLPRWSTCPGEAAELKGTWSARTGVPCRHLSRLRWLDPWTHVCLSVNQMTNYNLWALWAFSETYLPPP